MKLGLVVKNLQKLAGDNASTILTVTGVVGTVTTAYLTGKASYKAASVVADAEEFNLSLNKDEPPMNFKEKARLTWMLYIPPVASGTATITAIIFAHRVSAKRIAALAAAYSVSEKAFHDYKEKIVDKLGENKERAVRDEIAQDRLNKNPVDNNQVIVTGRGEVLCFDAYTGRYFYSDMETLRKAENTINYKIHDDGYASLSEYYDEIGLEHTAVSDQLGWNYEHKLEIGYSTLLSTDGRPCIAIGYEPKPDFPYFQK